MSNGPMNRKKNVVGKASEDSMKVHGPAQPGGPVGAKDGYQQRKTQQAQRPSQPRQPQRPQGTSSQRGTPQRGGGGMKLILIAIVVLLLGGGGGLSGLFGGGDNTGTPTTTGNNSGILGGGSGISSLVSGGLSSLLSSGTGSSGLEDILGGSWFSGQSGIGSTPASSSSGTTVGSAAATGANSTSLDRKVAAGSRDRYTTLVGDGKDTMTILVYMCGADLESKSAMATRDLQEMLDANVGDKINLVIFTGGCTGWRNKTISSTVNQIWQVQGNGLACLEKNYGTGAMTDPETLSSFIQYGKKNFKTSRYALILWDHGSGSVSGYGYDERNPRAGSMSLAGLNTAFKKGGLKFDFVGFDTCLMATVENALMVSNYADYLIASEETEPGIGWYYTNWLQQLSKNPSIATLDLGKTICDDFVSRCAKECRGQMTTLSLVDLAELSHTVPSRLNAFADSVTAMITAKDYKTVSNARNGSREFAASSRIDQVDLCDLCNKMGTSESAALVKALRSAVKYNRTNIPDAFGLSVYFPYQRVSNVDKAVSNYAAIGMDDSYSKAIRAFASVEASGQAVSGGGSPLSSLFGSGASSSGSSDDLIGSLLSSFLGGGSGMEFLSGRTLNDAQMQEYLTENRLDPAGLTFQRYNGQYVIDLPAAQWALVHSIDMNMFYDIGTGYVDLGLDNLFEIDPQTGLMIADTSGTWLSINRQPVPYYHEISEKISDSQWRITGYVPALLTSSELGTVRANLLIVFDQDHESGYVAGARAVYDDAVETIAKNMIEITPDTTIQCLADLYDKNQNYMASYAFGNPISAKDGLSVADVELSDPGKTRVCYRFTDIYNQAYWTPVIGK